MEETAPAITRAVSAVIFAAPSTIRAIGDEVLRVWLEGGWQLTVAVILGGALWLFLRRPPWLKKPGKE